MSGLFVELTHECPCGAWAYARAKLMFCPIGEDERTGTWLVGEIVMPEDWRLDASRQPRCPICSGV